MAYDKVVDSAQLDGALSATADAIRGKTGGTEQIPWDAGTGFADAIAAIAAGGGGGTLGMNSGTVTLSKSFTPLNIQHGCGKLPLALLVYPIADYTIKDVNLLSGIIWHRESYCLLLRTSTTALVNSLTKAYHVPTQTPDDNSPKVDAEKLYCNPPAQWLAGTHAWIAIYEV